MTKVKVELLRILFIGVGIALVVGVLSWLVQLDMSSPDYEFKYRGEQECVEAGGIFYPGGWGASNCVFPPNNINSSPSQ